MHLIKDLRKMTMAALIKELTKAKFVKNKTFLTVVSWKEKANHKVWQSRRFVARIKTVMVELKNLNPIWK